MASTQWQAVSAVRKLAEQEQGAICKQAKQRIALVYPSPYHVAMSSLGYQTIYRLINAQSGFAADRAMLPTRDRDSAEQTSQKKPPLLTIESERPVGQYSIVAFSVAYELEIAGLLECLELAGIPVLRSERGDKHPLIVAGGPLTFSNPVPIAPFVDVIIMGEGEQPTLQLLSTIEQHDCDRDAIVDALQKQPGFYIPETDGDTMPPIAAADMSLLPAQSQILTPNTELRSMFLTEAARGCSRGCTYCVMRRSTNGGMRIIAPKQVLAGIPPEAKRVGLVGAAVTDHPRITEIVAALVEKDREVGISSLRADKLTDDLVGMLARGGYRTLTVAFDGASQKLRDAMERRTTEKHVLRTAELAKRHGLKTVKLYMMVGVPGETDADLAELVAFVRELSKVHPGIALGVAPFVAKRNTPLDGCDFAGIPIVNQRLNQLRHGLRNYAEVRPTSARWAWVEYMLAQGTSRAGLAVLDAYRAGGRFADYKRAFSERGCRPSGPIARVPSSAELIALRKTKRPSPATPE